MLGLAARGVEPTVVADQIGRPTFATDLAARDRAPAAIAGAVRHLPRHRRWRAGVVGRRRAGGVRARPGTATCGSPTPAPRSTSPTSRRRPAPAQQRAGLHEGRARRHRRCPTGATRLAAYVRQRPVRRGQRPFLSGSHQARFSAYQRTVSASPWSNGWRARSPARRRSWTSPRSSGGRGPSGRPPARSSTRPRPPRRAAGGSARGWSARCRRRCCRSRRRGPSRRPAAMPRQWSSTCSQSRTLSPSP